jgi:hypothetical protein
MGKKKNTFEALFWGIFTSAISLVFIVNPTALGDYLSLYLLGIKITIIMLSIFALYIAFKCVRNYRIMEDTPTSKIRSCSQGFVELEGLQDNLAGQKTLGKLSNRNYTWYSYSIEKYVKRGKNSRWEILEEGVSDDFFVINDYTGTCVVNPNGAEVETKNKLVWKGFTRTPTYVPRNKLSKATGSIFGDYRYTEHYMLPKTHIYAIGMFKTIEQQNYLTNQKQADNTNTPFILSDIPQKELINKFKVKSILYISMFIMLAISYPITTQYYFAYWKYMNSNLSGHKHSNHYSH